MVAQIRGSPYGDPLILDHHMVAHVDCSSNPSDFTILWITIWSPMGHHIAIYFFRVPGFYAKTVQATMMDLDDCEATERYPSYILVIVFDSDRISGPSVHFYELVSVL